MKPFIVSRKFGIPFLITLFLYLSILVVQFWSLFRDDFEGKNLSSAVKVEWLLLTGGSFFTVSLLLAILIGTVFYVHHCAKKTNNQFSFVTRINGCCVVAVALLGCWYVSFIEPQIKYKSTILLADVYYTKKGDTHFGRSETGFKNERMLNLQELFSATDSIQSSFQAIQQSIFRNIKMNIRQQDLDNVLDDLHGTGTAIQLTDITQADISFGTQNSWACCIRDIVFQDIRSFEQKKQAIGKYKVQIMKKIVFPLMVVLFFGIGLVLGLSFFKTNVIFPLLIALFFIFPVWYFLQKMFDTLLAQNKMGAFTSTTGVVFVFGIVTAAWALCLKKMGFFNHSIAEHNSEALWQEI